MKEVRGNMHPRARTTTETISWQCPCGAAGKMERQVTISCPTHDCHCWHGTPSAGHHHHHNHQQHHQLEGTRALAAKESNSGRHALMNTAAPVVAVEFWVPDPYLMVQQLREFEPLYDEAVALRVQLEEYKEEIEKSKRDTDGRNWFLALPENIRNVLVMARDAIDTYIAISTPPAK